MHRKTKIFLSYSYNLVEKSELVRLLNDLSDLKTIDTWIGEHQLNSGAEILTQISTAISNADYFIQIEPSKKSNWSQIEFQLAYAEELKNHNLKIIRILLNKNTYSGGLLAQGGFGCTINFYNNYERGFADLIKYINVNSSDSLTTIPLDRLIDHRTIIEISSNVNDKLIAHFSKHPDELKVINRRLFEELVAELFFGFGFNVELTQQTRDGGRDVIAIKNSETDLKYLIECKRPDPGNLIGIKPVRELFGVKQDEKASKAILATTSFFSKDAQLFFERNKWELEPKDFNGIMQWIDAYKKTKKIT